MKKLFNIADRYVEQSTWVDFSLIKLCLGAMGVIIGCLLPEKSKKKAVLASAGIFTATYAALMAKFIRVAREKDE